MAALRKIKAPRQRLAANVARIAIPLGILLSGIFHSSLGRVNEKSKASPRRARGCDVAGLQTGMARGLNNLNLRRQDRPYDRAKGFLWPRSEAVGALGQWKIFFDQGRYFILRLARQSL
jgi:hypothetical protein